MSALLAIFQLISVILILIYEYTRKSISLFMWGTLVILFGIPHCISIILNKSYYNDEIMIKASLFVISFNIVYLISRIMISKLRLYKKKSNMYYINKIECFKERKVTLVDNKIKKYLFILLLLCILVLLFYSQKHLGGILNASWGGFYNLNKELGNRNILRYTQFLFFASAGIVFIFKENNNKFLFYLSVVFIVLYSTVTGNRITILPLLVAIILPFIFDDTRNMSIKNIIILIILAVVSVYVVYFLRLLRIYGGVNELFTSLSLNSINSLVIDMLLNGDGELSLRNAFYHFIQYNNNFPSFNEGHTYLRLFFIVVPTSLLGGLKPPDFAISMGSAWTNNFQNTTFSMHPTLYGDVFANFYWYGIIWAIFWAIFNAIIDRLANRKNATIRSILYVIFGIMFVIVGRGSVYNAVFTAFISCIIISSIYCISKIKIL